MKMVQKSENVQSGSEVMCDYWATKEEINEASIKIFIEMYDDTKDCLLRKLKQDLLFRFSKFLLIECQQFLDIFHFHICSVCFFYQIVIFKHSHSNLILKKYLVLLSLGTLIKLQYVTKHVGISNFN